MSNKNKLQYPNSNRHGMPVTKNDILRIRDAYQRARLVFDVMTIEELESIEESKEFEGKKLTGSKAKALAYSIDMHKNLKHIKNQPNHEPEQAQA